ncbi:EamA family transporter [Lentzea sp. CA-135723]|uniref:EamA family transporter n=1 Tax=Lentzea sp. CA-135723 TaxID=3239950 RepID=UPI003D8C3BF1
MAALRFGAAALVLVALLRFRPGGGFSWRDARRAGGAGLIGVFGYKVLFFWAVSLAPAIDGSVIVPVLGPVLTTVFFLLSGRESATPRRVAELALGAGESLTELQLVGAVVTVVGAVPAVSSSRAAARR